MSRAWLGIGALGLWGLLSSPLAAQGPGRSDLFAFQGLDPAQNVQAEIQDQGVTFLGTAKWAGLAISGGIQVKVTPLSYDDKWGNKVITRRQIGNENPRWTKFLRCQKDD